MGDCYDSDCDGSSMSVEKFLNIMDEIPDTSQDDYVNRNCLLGINNSFCHDGTNVSSVPNGFQDSEVSSYETHLMSSSFSLSHKLPPTNEYPGYFLVGDYPGNLDLLSQQSSKITSEIRSCTSRSSQDPKAYVDGMSDQMEEDNVNCERSGKPTYCIATSMETSNDVALSSRKYTHLQSSLDDDDILVASNRSVLGWDTSQLDTSRSDVLCIDIDDTVFTAEEESHHDPVIVEQPKVDHSEEVKATPISSNVEFSAMTCNASCIGEGQSASAKITDNHEDLNRESSFRTFFGSNHLAKNHEASNFSRATAHEAPSFDEGSHFLDECAAKQNYMKNVTRASNSSCEGVFQSTLAKLTVHEVMKCEAPVGLSLGFHSRAEILAHEIPNFNKVLHVENASKPSMAGIQQNCLSYGTKDTISSYDGVHQFALDKATTNLEDMKCDTLFLTPMGYRSQTKAHEGSNGSNFPGKIFSKAPVAVIKNCMKDEPHAGNSSRDMLHKAMQGNITVIEDMKIEAKFPPYQGCHSQVKAHELPNFTKEFKFHDGNFSKPHISVIQKNCMKNETQASNSLCDGVCQSTRAMLTVNLEEMEYGKAFSPSWDCKLQGKAYEVTKFNQGHHFRNKNALKTPISVIQQNQMKNQTKSCRVFNKKGDAHVQDTNSGLITESLRLGLSYDDSHDVCIIEDNDICVLEDMSQPASCNPCRNTINPAQRISSLPSVGGIRLKTNEERSILRFALQDLTQPKSESSPPDGSLSVSLLRHQRIALSWMVQKETCGWNCSGGILADDQGLGKTVSTIALILKERSPTSGNVQGVMKQCKLETLDLEGDNDAVTKHSVPCDAEALAKPKGRPSAGTLIVCPTSVLQQWDEELHRKVTSEANLSVHVYHGPNRTKDPYELSKYDVVLTTYSIVTMEVPKQPSVNEDYSESPSSSFPHVSPCKKRKPEASNTGRRPSKGHRGVGGSFIDLYARPLAKVGWFRVVLDEAQSIKNHRTHVARACWGLRAKRRWCLSGTPIQNTVDDLYSYLRFLRYDPFVTYKAFYSAIKAPISKCPENGYKMLQALLKTVMLRRTKGSFLDGKPIVALPPKSIELRKVDFSKEEREFYTKLEADSRAQFEVYAAAGTVKQNYVNILLMLLRLRQACDHPFLVNDYARTSAWKSSSLEAADRLPPEMQAHLLTVLEGSLAICSMCNDSPEDAVVAACGDVFCYQCVSEHLMGDNSACPNEKCRSPLSTSCIFSRDTLRASLRGNESDRSNPAETVPGSSVALSGESFDSAKIKAAAQVLEAISKPQPSGEKAIVFSQWARMLDLLERCLKRCSIQYRRLDGTMSVAARDRAVKDFNNIPEISVIIMSLKAASLGLNMVAACHVILLDLWWNPTTEDQAIDRAHRIGQTRPVTVLRLTVKDTVEDRILALQQKKREMVASAFGDDESSTLQSRLTVDDLKFLFTA